MTLAALLCVAAIAAVGSSPAGEGEREPAPAPSERVVVRVIDAEGRPVAGARVGALSLRAAQEPWRLSETLVKQSEWLDAFARWGAESRTDTAGHTALEWHEGGLSVTASRPGEFASGRVYSPSARVTTLTLAPDSELAVQVVGPDGSPRGGVDVALYRTISRPGGSPPAIAWHARTALDSGMARLPHAQLFVGRPEVFRYSVGFAIPLADHQLVELDPSNLPEQPVPLLLPPTGSLAVETAQTPPAFARCRKLPGKDPSTLQGGALTSWSRRDPVRAPFVDGRAFFEYVGLGLELQVEAHRDDMVDPVQRVVLGPTRTGATAVVRLEGENAPGGQQVTAEPAWIAKGSRRIQPEFLSVHATTASNDAFQLCVDAAGDGGSTWPKLSLHFQGETLELTGAHMTDGDDAYRHDYLSIASPAQAQAIADALSVPLALRGERPYAFEAEFSVERPSFESGEEIVVTMTLRNVGEVSVGLEVGGWQRMANRHALFRFEACRGDLVVPSIGRTRNFGGLMSILELAPGQEFVQRAQLNRFLDLSQPGDYEVDVSYLLRLAVTPFPFLNEPYCPAALGQYSDRMNGTVRFSLR